MLTCNVLLRVRLGCRDGGSSHFLLDVGIRAEHLRKDLNDKSIRCNEIRLPCAALHSENIRK